MSPLRDSDLTTELRRRVGLPPTPAGRRPGGRQVTGGGRWRCATCELDLTAWAAVLRHRADTGHARYAIPLTTRPDGHDEGL